MRPRTITVDVTRGGDYALADYHRQSRRNWLARHPGALIVRITLAIEKWLASVKAIEERMCEFGKAMRKAWEDVHDET